MIYKLLIYKILQLFAIMIIGFIIAKFKVVKEKDSLTLSKISLFLLMPSAIINSFDFERSEQTSKGLVLAFISAIAIHIVLYLLDMLFCKRIGASPVERASIMYSNAGNLIIPIVSFVLGEEWVVYSIAFMSVQLVFIWSHGVRTFNAKEKFSIKKILLNVNIIAIAIGLLLMLFNLRLPQFAKDITSSFGGMLGPVGMIIAGILAAGIDFKAIFGNKRLYATTITRVVIYPAIVLFAVILPLSFLSVDNKDKILLISFLASITPAAATITQFAQMHNSEPEYATAINIFSTVACIVTMPLFIILFNFVIN